MKRPPFSLLGSKGVAWAVLSLAAWLPAVRAQSFTETAEQRQTRMAAWREARFGLFLHWGVFAIPARGEWVQWNEQIPVTEYAKLADQFKPANFDPKAWVATAQAAGMKYMVLTARHHDGFALFDDPGSDFTSVKTRHSGISWLTTSRRPVTGACSWGSIIPR
jgi:alpha-L-fucosidase